MADTNEALPELPVLAYGVELPSGKFSRIRVGLDDARRYVDEWNFDHPKPPLAKLTALTDHATATAVLSELRAEMQQLALRSLTSEGEWIEMTGELRAEVERRGDVIRGHEATLTRLQGDLLRERLKKEAAEQLYKNEVEMSGAEVERLRVYEGRYQLIRSFVVGKGYAPPYFRSIIGDAKATNCEFDKYTDAARSAASGATPNTTEGS